MTTVPGATWTEPVVPVATLSPPTFDTTCSPLLPPAVTDSDLVVGVAEGFSVRLAVRVTPPPVTEIVTTVCTFTSAVVIWIPAEVLPAEIITSFPTCARVGLLLETWKN